MKRIAPPPPLEAPSFLDPDPPNYNEGVLAQSTKLNFEIFQTRFPRPTKLKENSAMERFFVRTFVEILLPACAGLPEVDGPEWDKPAIKVKLSNLWKTFTLRQQELIHTKLNKTDSSLRGITLGTLRQINYARTQ